MKTSDAPKCLIPVHFCRMDHKNIQFFTVIWHPFCRRLLSPANITFLKTGWLIQLIQFSKFNNFLWVCWFLNKNLSNFLPPVWKLHNPYFHTKAGFGRHSFHKRLFRASVQNCVYRSFQEKLFQNNFVNWRSYLGFCRKVTNSESGFVKNLQE